MKPTPQIRFGGRPMRRHRPPNSPLNEWWYSPGSAIQVLGSIPITFGDWNIPNPSFGPVSTDDHGILGMDETVPAGPLLMGPWDAMLGHRRRYTSSLFRSQARAAGLRVAWLSHWNSFSLPPALVVRTVEKALGGQRSAEFPPVSPLIFTVEAASPVPASLFTQQLLISTQGFMVPSP